MTVTVFSEALHPGAFIVSESDQGFRSRDIVTIPASQTILAGQILGRIGVPSLEISSAAAAAGNTGNGTLALDGTAPVSASAIDGVYVVEYLTATTFHVIDPNGKVVDHGVNGATFNNQVKFVITAGGTAFAAGDRFNITVGVVDLGDENFVPLNLSATDGSQNAAAIAIYPVVTGSGQTAKISAVRRQAEVRQSDLTFPSGATAAQISEIVHQLRGLGVICR